jgi:thiamine-phosphate pyrophosphorylase
MSARVVIITDRRLMAHPAAQIAAILAAVPRGSVAIQIREKDLDGAALIELARDVLAIAGDAPVYINDRVDIAIALGTGVHLPEAGLSVAAARTLAALPIGASRHDEAGALAAARDGAELVQLGPIFDTPGKLAIGAGLLGVRARMPATARIVAVGGITTPTHARAAIAAGADAVAIIRAAWTAADPAAVVCALIEAVDRGRAAR